VVQVDVKNIEFGVKGLWKNSVLSISWPAGLPRAIVVHA
jgi:hypothetical protein